jgi:hypothetical protein
LYSPPKTRDGGCTPYYPYPERFLSILLQIDATGCEDNYSSDGMNFMPVLMALRCIDTSRISVCGSCSSFMLWCSSCRARPSGHLLICLGLVHIVALQRGALANFFFANSFLLFFFLLGLGSYSCSAKFSLIVLLAIFKSP